MKRAIESNPKKTAARATAALLLLLSPACSGGPTAGEAQTQIRKDLRHIELGLKQYAGDKGSYPLALAELVRPECIYPRTEPRAELPRDPWGNPYLYVAPEHGAGLNLICLGSDAQVGGEGVAADVELRSFKSRAR